jgi:hypothetical protein
LDLEKSRLIYSLLIVPVFIYSFSNTPFDGSNFHKNNYLY